MTAKIKNDEAELYFASEDLKTPIAGAALGRRRMLKMLTGILGGMGLLSFGGFKAHAQPQDNRIATAIFAAGILNVTRTDGSKKTLADQGSLALFEGDKLSTGKVSQGYIVFTDGARMAINANTTLVLRTRKDSKGTVQTIKLAIGEIWAKIAKKTKLFEVESPNALASVSGTEFGFKVEMGSIISTLTVAEGEMDFGNLSGDGMPPQNLTKVTAGFQSSIRNQDPPLPPFRVNTNNILRWGRALNARFGPKAEHKGNNSEETGRGGPSGIPRERHLPPGISSLPNCR